MSVMKKILTFFMLLLILCACETRFGKFTHICPLPSTLK